MGFMDSVTNFAQGVGAKAKGNIDVVTLNAQISSITREVNNLYKSLGEQYYNLHKEDPECELGGIVKDIYDRLNRISELEGNIETTKESISAVQLINTDPASFNNASQGNANGQFVICPDCGNPVNRNNAFCTYCGGKL